MIHNATLAYLGLSLAYCVVTAIFVDKTPSERIGSFVGGAVAAWLLVGNL